MKTEDLQPILNQFDEARNILNSTHAIQSQSSNVMAGTVIALRDEINSQNIIIENLNEEIKILKQENEKIKQKKVKKDEPIAPIEPQDK